MDEDEIKKMLNEYEGLTPINKPKPIEPTPQIIPINKPEDLTPEPLEPPEEEDDDEYKIRKCDMEEVVRIRLEEEKKASKKETVYERCRREILVELRAKKDAEEQFKKENLLVCPSCEQHILDFRFQTCKACNEKEPTPKDLELKEKEKEQEKIKLDESSKDRKAKELQDKRIAEAKKKEEKDDEELMSTAKEVLFQGNNFSKACESCLGIDLENKPKKISIIDEAKLKIADFLTNPPPRPKTRQELLDERIVEIKSMQNEPGYHSIKR